MTCPHCSTVNDPSTRFCIRCGNPLPDTPVTAATSGPPFAGETVSGGALYRPPQPAAPSLPIAGGGARFGAGAINWVILRIVLAIVEALAGVHAGGVVGDLTVGGSVLILLYDVVRVLYSPFFWAFAGATPGMMMLGLRVVREDGSPIGLGTAIVRFLIAILGAIPLFLGWFWVLWDPRHQGWHDKVAGTLVVRVNRDRWD